MKKLILLLTLVSCHHYDWAAQPIVGPNGKANWVAITCREKFDCLVLAAKYCPTGYSFASEDQTSSWSFSANNYFAKGGSSKEITLLVECKPNYQKREIEQSPPF